MKYIFYLVIFLLSCITNTVVLSQIELPFYLSKIVSGVFLLVIPGMLLLKTLLRDELSLGRYILFSVGSSLALLIFLGLGVSLLAGDIGIARPLDATPFILLLDCLLVVLFSWSVIKELKYTSLNIRFSLPIETIPIALVSLLFPLLSFMGSQILNAGGNNNVTLLMLFSTSAFFFIVVLFHKFIPEESYPFILFCVALSVVWMYTMRSNHIVGYDINTEFRVFQINKSFGLWAMENINNAYNATLSISLLPVIITNILKINDEYVFKFVYPILFSLTPVAVYYYLRSFIPGILAFLAGFFFLNQFQFMQQIPAITRQEIAFLFLTIFFAISSSAIKSKAAKNTLFIFFGLSLVLSHYSTSYIVIMLLVGIQMLYLILKLLKRNKKIKSILNHSNDDLLFNFQTVIILFLVTFLWYGQYNTTLKYLTNVVKSTAQALVEDRDENLVSDQAKAALGVQTRVYNQSDIDSLNQLLQSQYRAAIKWIPYYSMEVISKYPILPVYVHGVPIANEIAYSTFGKVISVIKILFRVLSIIGILYMLYIFIKNKTEYSPSLSVIVLTFLATVLVLGSVVIPFISVAYNIERLYQQMLIFIAMSIVMGGVITLFFIKRYGAILILTLTFLLYFLYQSGVTIAFLGGNASLTLNNFGEDYGRFYIHDTEVASAKWLDKNKEDKKLIFADEYAKLRLESFTLVSDGVIGHISPIVLGKDNYVYTTYSNVILGITRDRYFSRNVGYNYPDQFLRDNKNLIYSNGSSLIFQ